MEKALNLVPVNISIEMKNDYIDYAMSVIIGRALPDVRDGLKPVHRRILYTMHETRNTFNAPYKKSARIVGDVMGKYHPHGDAAIYDSLVRMAQNFNMRYTLVDGQGNFGSIDGDAPAAMRYTEVRMTRLSSEMILDIEKKTVDFIPNYDGSEEEPVVLPARIPNLLINGSSGIAVGMATNIPPHNIGEVINATMAMIDNPNISVAELCEIVKGPDFPTGGVILGTTGIKSAYETGRGIIKMGSKTEIEERKGDRTAIIVKEIPYQVNKARLIERIAELVNDKKIDGISDLRDESDREGMRIVIELKRDAIPQIVINQLNAMTPMRTSFGVIMLAIVDGQPLVLTIRDMLKYFVFHRRDVVTRRTNFELKQALEREHILLGYKIALDNLDAVIDLIRSSNTPEIARTELSKSFGMTEIQAQAILDLKLQRLTGLEREKILAELEECKGEIRKLREILASEKVLMKLIKKELNEVLDKYEDSRKTDIIPEEKELNIEDLIPDEEMVVTVSKDGFIKRNPLAIYKTQRRGGRGKTGMGTREEDFVTNLFVATAHSYIMIFTSKGRVFKLKVYELPEGSRHSKGRAIVNLLSLSQDEEIREILPVREFVTGPAVLFATKKGIVKKTELIEYKNIRSTGILAIKIEEGDDLISVRLIDIGQHVLLGTRHGKSIRFPGDQLRAIGRSTVGVRGIRLKPGDEVVGMEVLDEGASILTVTENGYGKRSITSMYRVQNRGGTGILTLKITKKVGYVCKLKQVKPDDEVMLISDKGTIIRSPVKQISQIGRVTQGVKLINLQPEERVVAVERIAEEEEE
jgi:DNA gyrase subunit A